MSKYILNPDGTIKKISDNKDLNKKEIGEEKLFNTFDNEHYQSVTEYLSANENNTGISFLGSEVGFKNTNPEKADLDSSLSSIITSNISTTKVKNTELLNDSHDFLTGENEKATYLEGKHVETILNFNSTGGDNKIFASEIEMAGGIPTRGSTNLIETSKKVTIAFEILVNAIVHITAAEAIFALNSLSDSNKNQIVEENFHLHLGENGAIDLNAFDSFIFKRLNYPRTKIAGFASIGERISAFIVGFLELISGDNLFDFNKIGNLSQEKKFYRLVNEKYGSVFNISENSLLQISNILGSTLFYLADSLATLTSASINRLMLIERKISHQNYWIDNLYDAKKSDKDPTGLLDSGVYVDNFMKSMDYYFFKFVIERMHIGLKIIRYYEYNKSYDSHASLESSYSRVGLSKSGEKTISLVTNKEDNYNWSLTKTGSNLSQSTRIRSLPQAFLMSKEIVSLFNSPTLSPEKAGEISSSLLQNFSTNKDRKTDGNRLSQGLVKKLESYLNAEYMPFYFHDLRTNEIISFHAFIDNISDSFSPEYTTHSGFGRTDDVKNYVKTTRNISISFTIASTSKNDHDLMWYQINKLVSMVYPQWSRGVNNKISPSMQYPFTQVPTNSPLIRLRVGDVIKSNYSKKNLARKFGFDKLYNNNDIGSELYNDVEENIEIPSARSEETIYGHYSAGLKNKNLLKIMGYNRQTDFDNNTITRLKKIKTKKYLLPGLYLAKPKTSNPLIDIPILSLIGSNGLENQYIHIKNYELINSTISVNENENNIKVALANVDYQGLIFICDKNSTITREDYQSEKYTDFKEASPDLREEVPAGFFGFIKKDNKDFGKITPASSVRYNTDKRFLFENPILGAYESSKGEGLAGFITNLDINYNEQLWETSEEGSKAPHAVKVSISYSPIHDIPLGIDKEGMMTSPAYNVGGLNRSLFSSVYDNAYDLYDDYLSKLQSSQNRARQKLIEGLKMEERAGDYRVKDWSAGETMSNEGFYTADTSPLMSIESDEEYNARLRREFEEETLLARDIENSVFPSAKKIGTQPDPILTPTVVPHSIDQSSGDPNSIESGNALLNIPKDPRSAGEIFGKTKFGGRYESTYTSKGFREAITPNDPKYKDYDPDA